MTSHQHVAIYARISEDKRGHREGVEAQEQWGRAYAAEHWPDLPVELFADNDITAAKDDVHRPEFERLREWIRAGRVAHAWAVEQSRLTRLKLQWFELSADLLKTGVGEVHTRREGVVDLNGVVGDILAVLDAHEVSKLRKRVLDKMDVLAKAGRPHGNHGFGYRNVSAEDHAERKMWLRARWLTKRSGACAVDSCEIPRCGGDIDEWAQRHQRPQAVPLVDERGRKRIEHVPDEADALRDVAERILGGWTLSAAADSLNRRGLFTAKGSNWYASTLHQRLSSPGVAGLRVHQGEIVGKAAWHDIAILDETTWRAVCAKLSADRIVTRSNGMPLQVRSSRKGIARRHVLTGIGRCGVCEAPLAGGRTGERDNDRAVYKCDTLKGGRGCVLIGAVDLEEWVRDKLFDELDNPQFAAGLTNDEHAQRRGEIVEELTNIDTRRREVTERWNVRKLTTDQFDMMNEALIDDERVLNAELRALPKPPIGSFDPTEIRAAWPHMEFAARRQTVITYIDHVTVNRLWKGTGRVTQRDIADRAGVDTSYVNMALTGRKPKGISDETRARVLAAGEELGYDATADSLPRGATSRIADAAGVSKPTAAIAFGYAPRGIPDSTRRRVLAAAEELGYVPTENGGSAHGPIDDQRVKIKWAKLR